MRKEGEERKKKEKRRGSSEPSGEVKSEVRQKHQVSGRRSAKVRGTKMKKQ